MASERDRFFVSGVHAAGELVRFAPDDARKLATVLRARAGDTVTIVDSGGVEWTASIIVDDGIAARLVEQHVVVRELRARVVLAQCVPKGQKMDFIVEKATELGVSAIVPVRSARVEGERTGDAKRERWQRLARSAAQQSGRTVVPEIAPERDWPTLARAFTDYDRVYVAWEGVEAVPLREQFVDAESASSMLIVIGPEGGLTRDEVDAATAAGATIVSLGARILRTETAGLVVLAAWTYARGEL